MDSTVLSLASQSMYEDELHYWREAYGSMTPAELAKIASPTMPLNSMVSSAIPDIGERQSLRMLDVGCGPVSVLGWHHPVCEIKLTGVDPLIDEYKKMTSGFGLHLPYATLNAGAENLAKCLPAEYYDYVFSRNALDHVSDAPLAIMNMLSVTKPGGVVDIEVFENEAVAAGYGGLHRWNFTDLDEQIIVWNRSTAMLMDSIVSPYQYTFTIQDKLGAAGKKTFNIRIYKCSKKTCKHVRFGEIGDIYYDLGRRIVWLSSAKVNKSLKIFVHTHGFDAQGAKYFFAKNYLWPQKSEILNVKIPNVQRIDRIKIGQYDEVFSPSGHGYVNHWEVELR